MAATATDLIPVAGLLAPNGWGLAGTDPCLPPPQWRHGSSERPRRSARAPGPPLSKSGFCAARPGSRTGPPQPVRRVEDVTDDKGVHRSGDHPGYPAGGGRRAGCPVRRPAPGGRGDGSTSAARPGPPGRVDGLRGARPSAGRPAGRRRGRPAARRRGRTIRTGRPPGRRARRAVPTRDWPRRRAQRRHPAPMAHGLDDLVGGIGASRSGLLGDGSAGPSSVASPTAAPCPPPDRRDGGPRTTGEWTVPWGHPHPPSRFQPDLVLDPVEPSNPGTTSGWKRGSRVRRRGGGPRGRPPGGRRPRACAGCWTRARSPSSR